MARLSMILSTGLLVVWISVLGSGGSLLDGWKAGPKAVSPQVFGLLLWSRLTVFQHHHRKRVQRLDPSEPLKDTNNPLGLKLASTEALLPRPIVSLSWSQRSNNKVKPPPSSPQPVRQSTQLAPPSSSTRLSIQLDNAAPLEPGAGCGALCQNNNSSNNTWLCAPSIDCTDLPTFRSRTRSNPVIGSQSRFPSNSNSARTARLEMTNTTPGSRSPLPTPVHAKPAHTVAKPMSMLLYGSASRTPTSDDLPQETEASNSACQTQHAHPYDDTISLGIVTRICERSSISNIYETTTLCHRHFNHAMDPVAATSIHHKRALALHKTSYSATKPLNASEDHLHSAVLSQDPNSVTSMIAISTVLIFATFVTF